jgi:hypothetical protein
MRFTPRQIVVRAREAAYLLLATLDHDAMVSRFLQNYAKEHNRGGVLTQPTLLRELMGSVRREALLAMVTCVDEALPRRLGIATRPDAPSAKRPATPIAKSAAKKASRGAKGKLGTRGTKGKAGMLGGKTKSDGREAEKKGRTSQPALTARERAAQAETLNLFREEFFLALGSSMRWSKEEFAEFARDYDLYQMIESRAGATQSSLAAKGPAAGPFVDRCGLLVDPSMLEQARRAAGRFQAQLDTAAEGVLKKVFSRRREN